MEKEKGKAFLSNVEIYNYRTIEHYEKVYFLTAIEYQNLSIAHSK